MDYREQLENLRSVIFTGKEKEKNAPHMTHEQYIELYEQRENRDPLEEFKKIEKVAAPLLPYFEKKLEQIARMEALINPSEDKESEEDEFEKDSVLESLYEEIATIDSEEQWQKFISTF